MMLQGYGLGRLESPDSRDSKYKFGLVIPEAYPARIKRKQYTPGVVLNQGNTGTCVGQGWAGFLACTPLRTHSDPYYIYDKATRLDEWPGNEGNQQSGTSVRAGAKALVEMSHLRSGVDAGYVWAQNSHDVANWILRRSPVVIGIPWYQGMFTLTPEGYIVLSGQQIGGHCVLVYGCDLNIRTLYIQNSWGASWGMGGRCKMTFDVLDNLLSNEGGECCAAVERKLLV